MIEEIKIKNNNLNQTIILNNKKAAYLLDNDKAIDWGSIQCSNSTYDLSSGIGVGIVGKSMNVGRDISIVGWLINDDYGTIIQKKDFLRKFLNPLDTLSIYAGDYKINGYASEIVKYSNSNSENNDIICKFSISVFCPNPLFTLSEEATAKTKEKYEKKFVFPLIWVTGEKIIFGIRKQEDNPRIINPGTVSTGFTATITTSGNISGLAIKNLTNKQQFRFSSTFTLTPKMKVILKTTYADRGIWIEVDDKTTKAFDKIDLFSDWPILEVGRNDLALTCTSGDISNVIMDLEIEPLFYAMEDQ